MSVSDGKWSCPANFLCCQILCPASSEKLYSGLDTNSSHGQDAMVRDCIEKGVDTRISAVLQEILKLMLSTECLKKNVTLTRWPISFIMLAFTLKYTCMVEKQAFSINLAPADSKSVNY